MKSKTVIQFSCSLMLLFCSYQSIAQKDSLSNAFGVKGGIDVLSNFIWRGVALDPYPCVQPALILGNKNIELGMLGSYSLGGAFNATPFFFRYNIYAKSVIISPMLFDYYYPARQIPISNFDDGGGAHTLEASVNFKWTTIPLRVFLSANVLNDAANSTYIEAGYTFKASGPYSVELFGGAALTEKSYWLGAEDIGLTNVGVTGMRGFKLSENYTLPVSISYNVHTQLEYSFLSAKVSFPL
jgi:hypothetical protein